MEHVIVSENLFAKELLTVLRDANTSRALFRETTRKLASILLTDAANTLPVTKKDIQTPLTQTEGIVFEGDVVLLPILRAGLALMPAALALFPGAEIGMVGLKRDENTAVAHEYYSHIPPLSGKHLFILDPMLATGGSMLALLQSIQDERYASVRLVTVICAPEGIEAVHAKFPTLAIITASVDERLNDRKFIVPGLGDFGDRYFSV